MGSGLREKVVRGDLSVGKPSCGASGAHRSTVGLCAPATTCIRRRPARCIECFTVDCLRASMSARCRAPASVHQVAATFAARWSVSASRFASSPIGVFVQHGRRTRRAYRVQPMCDRRPHASSRDGITNEASRVEKLGRPRACMTLQSASRSWRVAGTSNSGAASAYASQCQLRDSQRDVEVVAKRVTPGGQEV